MRLFLIQGVVQVSGELGLTHCAVSEVVSKDTADWARDLALIRKLLAGELNPPPAEDAVVLRFSAKSSAPDRMN